MPRLPMPRFNLKAPRSKTETLILLIFRYRGYRLVYSTSLNIHPKDWDQKAQRPIGKERRPDLWAMRRRLDDIFAYTRAIYIENQYGAISPDCFKTLLDSKIGKNKPEQGTKNHVSFAGFLKAETKRLKQENDRDASAHQVKYINLLSDFIAEYGDFEFSEVDWVFRTKLIDFLAEKEVRLSYGNKALNVFRQLMERARRQNLHENTQYQGSGWTVTQKRAVGTKVILTERELEHLSKLYLTGYYKKVRDLFLIGAGTGQRFSDYSGYEPNHFYRAMDGTPILSVISQKTDMPAKVPLNIFPWLMPILEEYEFSSPKLSIQKLNEGIKDIGIKARFDDQVLVVDQLMGRKPRVVKSYVPKHDLLSSHTCRRSFATNLYRMGYSLAQIMPMTGHATESQLRTYIGIDAEENAIQVANSLSKKRKQ